MELVCAFLALLEAVKARQIRIFQNRLFGDIRIRAVTGGAEVPQQEDGPADGDAARNTDAGEDAR
jgi:segregation and condensation protein A